MKSKFFCMLFLSAYHAVCSADPIGDDIASKSRGASSGFGGSIATVQMVNSSPSSGHAVYEMSITTKEFPEGNRTIMQFLKPESDRGTVFMVHGKDGPDDQWIFLPRQQRLKKISGSLKNSAFLGSEFTFNDMSDSKVYDYVNDYVSDADVNGYKCFVVDRAPKDSSDDYQKVRTYIEKERYLIHRAEYFNKRGEIIKTADFSDYAKGSDGRWRAALITMKSATSGKSTTLKTTQIEIDPGIPDSVFNVASISAGR